MDIELAHDSFTVRLNRAHTDTQPAGDFLVAQALGDSNQNFAFAGADLARMRAFARTPDKLVKGQASDVLAEEGFTGIDDFDGFDQIFGGRLFENITAGSGL